MKESQHTLLISFEINDLGQALCQEHFDHCIYVYEHTESSGGLGDVK